MSHFWPTLADRPVVSNSVSLCAWICAVCRCGSGWTSSRILILSLTSTSQTLSTRACRSWHRRSWTVAPWANTNSVKIRHPANFFTPKTFPSTASGSKGMHHVYFVQLCKCLDWLFLFRIDLCMVYGSAFLVPAYPGCPGKKAVKRM